MADVTPASATETGNSRLDDIVVYNITYAAAGDYAYINTRGYDYVSFLPIGPDGTEPAGTETFSVYGWTAESGTMVAANQALVPEEAGRHKRATVTSSARNAGYLFHPPSIITVRMAGSDSANMVLRVELRKRKTHGAIVGRG